MQEINFTSTHKFLVSALQQPWTAIYTKVIAIALLYGATVHFGNIFGLTGTSWLDTPFLWRSLDIILLIFDLVTAIALWRGFAWSIWLLFGGIFLLQILPYTLLRSHFVIKPEDGQILNGLLGTEVLLLSIFVLLLWLRK
ncbi:hypothetical protein IQ255_28280 [Pleurocapsales cyanobacterium LEGE 10410]|nr:hypothetical protein [Pleurocapsales cyanobacterium LEGE 10410]